MTGTRDASMRWMTSRMALSRPPGVSRRRTTPRANRARGREAAGEAFRERGVAAEIKDLAERAEVGVGTIYRNFPGGKDDLVLAILKDLLATSFREVREAEAVADPVDGLRYLLERGLTRVA